MLRRKSSKIVAVLVAAQILRVLSEQTSRSDFSGELDSGDCNDGLFTATSFCNDGEFVVGAELFWDISDGDPDETGAGRIRLRCSTYLSWTSSGELLRFHGAGTYVETSNTVFCPPNEFMIGYQLKTDCPDLGVADVVYSCTNSSTITHDTGVPGTFTTAVSCSAGSAVCGARARDLPDQGVLVIDKALTDVRLTCCTVPTSAPTDTPSSAPTGTPTGTPSDVPSPRPTESPESSTPPPSRGLLMKPEALIILWSLLVVVLGAF